MDRLRSPFRGDDQEFTRWPPELRRAVMSVRPDYFALPFPDRLRYRVDLPKVDRQGIVAALLKLHGHAYADSIAREEAERQVAVELQNQINEWLQPLIGLGEAAFSLNEHFEPGRSLLDFQTLLAYDQNSHAFQEDARSAEDPDYVRRSYAGALNGTWARCLRDGRLCYLTLTMAASRVIERIDEAANEEMERLIPHRYVLGPNHGREEYGQIQWDQRVDAAGQEGLLEELQRRVWAFESERLCALQLEFNQRPLGATFLVESPYTTTDPGEQGLLVVFSDPSALERTRFTSFLSDCSEMFRPDDWLTSVEMRELEGTVQFVNEQHHELLRTFEPNVLPLRRRRKVMMQPRTFKDLD